MTAKRFHYDSALEKIYDYDTCEDGIAESLDCFDACELLNELHEEKEHLKQSFKEVLKDLEVTTFDKELLEKENERLKQQLSYIEYQFTEYRIKVGDRE